MIILHSLLITSITSAEIPTTTIVIIKEKDSATVEYEEDETIIVFTEKYLIADFTASNKSIKATRSAATVANVRFLSSKEFKTHSNHFQWWTNENDN